MVHHSSVICMANNSASNNSSSYVGGNNYSYAQKQCQQQQRRHRRSGGHHHNHHHRLTRRPPDVPTACLVNRNLRLPPILPKSHFLDNAASFDHPQQGSEDITLTLPRLDLCTLGLRRNSSCNNNNNNSNNNSDLNKDGKTCNLEYPSASFPIPRVYDILPPIGKSKVSLVPRAPAYPPASSMNGAEKTDKSTGDALRKRRTSRAAAVQQNRTQAKQVSSNVKTDVLAKPSTVVNESANSEVQNAKNISVEERSNNQQDPLIPQEGERACQLSSIHFSDVSTLQEPTAAVSSNQAGPNSTPNIDESKEGASCRQEADDASFLYFKTIPKNLQAYADIYPPSPPPTDRKAWNIVTRQRRQIKEDNKVRRSYTRNYGRFRRNATCTELDECLIKAPELLREIFLRKTMEELCMLW